MTELLVAGFNNAYRAAQVLLELRQRARDEASDLDHAVCIARHADGRIQVQQTIDPADVDSVTWPALWSALIAAAMVTCDPFAMPAAAASTGASASARTEWRVSSSGCFPPAGWWTSAVGVSYEFVRDLGAILMPGCSAVLLLVRSPAPSEITTRLRRSGGTVLRHQLNSVQVAELQAMLDRSPIEHRFGLDP